MSICPKRKCGGQHIFVLSSAYRNIKGKRHTVKVCKYCKKRKKTVSKTSKTL